MVFRSISITLRDRQINKNIREQCSKQVINKWVGIRKKYGKEHVNRMSPERLVNICENVKPHGRRPVGKPKKRWKDNIQSTTKETE